jgi:hypothetical protein
VGGEETCFFTTHYLLPAMTPEGGTLNIKSRPKLKADKNNGAIEPDSETTLQNLLSNIKAMEIINRMPEED